MIKRSTTTAPTATEIWLRGQGVSKKKARQLRDLNPHAIEAVWNATIPAEGSMPTDERNKRIGGLLDRWEVAPPARTVSHGDSRAHQQPGRGRAPRPGDWRRRTLTPAKWRC